MKRPRLITALLMVAIPLLPVHSQTTPPGQREINGAERPDLVPDRKAFMILFLSMSDKSGTARNTRVSRLRQGGFTDAQATGVINAAIEFRVSYDSIMARTKQVKAANPARPFPPAAIAEFDALFEQGWKALDVTKASLERDLGPKGVEQLRLYLETTVKPNLLVVPGR